MSLAESGYALVSGLYTNEEVEQYRQSLLDALQNPDVAASIRSQAGSVYAARNILDLWQESTTLWRREPLFSQLRAILGSEFGLVRALYFDKPPDHTWALGWHKDLTIAVKDNRLTSDQFSKPTTKANVAHVEAPEWVLEQMLTVRIHFDQATEANGALQVIPGSHQTGKALQLGEVAPVTIIAAAGDALLIRPLVAHSSRRSEPTTTIHRRILHLEFAGVPELPDGYQWNWFLPAE